MMIIIPFFFTFELIWYFFLHTHISDICQSFLKYDDEKSILPQKHLHHYKTILP